MCPHSNSPGIPPLSWNQAIDDRDDNAFGLWRYLVKFERHRLHAGWQNLAAFRREQKWQ